MNDATYDCLAFERMHPREAEYLQDHYRSRLSFGYWMHVMADGAIRCFRLTK